jgi:hypothetical protein
MRLPNLKENCGCDDRKFIMFEAGKLGLKEAAILALPIIAIIVAKQLRKG